MTYSKDQTRQLREVLRAMADKISDPETGGGNADVGELVRVLERMIAGKSLYESFGAPGDWGYGQPVGDALSALYKCEASHD